MKPDLYHAYDDAIKILHTHLESPNSQEQIWAATAIIIAYRLRDIANTLEQGSKHGN